MSKIEVDKVDPQSGTALEIGTSGDTVTVPSGVGLTLTDSTLLLPITINTDKLDPKSGTALEIGTSGDTITVPSGATFNVAGTLQQGGSALVTGKILQIVQATSTGGSDSTSTTYAATALTAAITPSSASNKVLVLACGNAASSSASGKGIYSILRDSTEVTSGSSLAILDLETNENTIAINYLDSPSSTSEIDYYVAHKTNNVSYTSRWNMSNRTTVMVLMEVAG